MKSGGCGLDVLVIAATKSGIVPSDDRPEDARMVVRETLGGRTTRDLNATIDSPENQNEGKILAVTMSRMRHPWNR